MERATKLLVLFWTGAALAAIVFFVRSGWGELPVYAALGFAIMAIGGAVTPHAVALPLLFAYVFPIVIRYQTNQNYAPYHVVWIAALLGALTPRAVRTRWHIPPPSRAVLVAGALVMVVSGTLVTFREFDFTTALLYTKRLSNSSIGGWPSQTVAGCLYSAVVMLAGVLWFDWLCAEGAGAARTAAIALAISFTLTIIVALYQFAIDITFMNPTLYGALGRASGLLMDGNVLGVCAGLWVGGYALVLKDSRWRVLISVLAGCVCWLAVWASGSRTGLAVAAIVTIFTARALLTSFAPSSSPQRRRRITVGAAVAVLAVAAAVLLRPEQVAGPLVRLRPLIPSDAKSASALASELWNRNGYGAVADAMIKSAPLVGVGIGGFFVMHPDFFTMAGIPPLPPDNAQNWFKQQVAELGALGSAPWLLWTVLFGVFVLRRHRGESPDARIPRGMLVAFAAVSLVGIPGQNVSAALTFWLAAFWYVSLAADDAPRHDAIGARTWIAIGTVVLAFGAVTWWRATTTLRVPVRAQRVGWPYVYGFYDREPAPDGGEQRWSAGHGVIVVDAPTRHLLLTIVPNALAQRRGADPLHMRVAVDRHAVVDADVTSAAAVSRYVHLDDEARVMIEADVNRTFRPSRVGLDDDRDLGLLMQWRFLDQPPSRVAAETGSDR